MGMITHFMKSFHLTHMLMRMERKINTPLGKVVNILFKINALSFSHYAFQFLLLDTHLIIMRGKDESSILTEEQNSCPLIKYIKLQSSVSEPKFTYFWLEKQSCVQFLFAASVRFDQLVLFSISTSTRAPNVSAKLILSHIYWTDKEANI